MAQPNRTRSRSTPPPDLARSNGHATAPVVATGPIIMPRYEWMAIGDDYYPGCKIKVWANMPHGLYRQIYGNLDSDSVAAALVQIAPEHNGWRNHLGVPYPPADDPEFWMAIPNELFNLVLIVIDDARHVLPNLVQRTRQTSVSTSERSALPAPVPAPPPA